MRPIDADALLENVFCINDIYGTMFVVKRGVIQRAPTIEAEPVRHGRWIAMSDADGVYWTCSECGEDIPRISHYNPQFDLFPRLESIDKTNYCPNCGAKMEK